MNNPTEYVDETKALDPSVLKNINSQAGDGEINNTRVGRDHKDKQMKNKTVGEQPDPIPEFEAVDFTSYKSIPQNSRYFNRVQDVANIVLNGYKVPFCSQDFRPISVPLTRQRVPVIPYDAFITSNGIVGGGSTTFSSWMTAGEETYFDDFLLTAEKFGIKMEEKTKAELMTRVSIWSNEYLDKGVRDGRARPSAVLGDWAYALPPTFSMTVRYIRTDVFAGWMYGDYTATSPAEKIIIINNADLRQFMNNDGGNYWPVEANTLCLALGRTSASVLTKLKLLGHSVIIDFDSSMNSTRGTLTTYNGVSAWEVSANSVQACDTDIAKVLNNTYSGIDIQWALFSNVLPLGISVGANSLFYQDHFDLVVYENTIADQFINFYATHRDYGNKLPVTSSTLPSFVQAWRIFKTVLTQRTAVEVGYVGPASPLQTYGKTLTVQNYYDMICGSFCVKTATQSTPHAPMWIPYEMWIMNGANLKLDDESYVDGESSVLVNENYLVPKSQVIYDMTTWSSSNTSGSTNYNYYVPNKASAQTTIFSGRPPRNCVSCIPCTIPNWNSTTETQTILWNKDQTIDFTYVNTGKNSNAVYRKKMVFTTAVRN